jgi:hypothetical protein
MLFARDRTLDFWFCRYGSQPVEVRFAGTEQAIARTGVVVRNASSNTIFLRGRTVTAIGEFDEALGVGTPLGGSEDLDYALRACRAARKVAHCDATLVGHRDKSPKIRSLYYTSALVVLARHARRGAATQLLRKIAVGVYLTLWRRLEVVNFIGALNRARAEFRDSRGRVCRPLRARQ